MKCWFMWKPLASAFGIPLNGMRIPDDADRRSGSCRSAVPIDGDQHSGMMPITDSGMIAIS
jgi:hypothetical protein